MLNVKYPNWQRSPTLNYIQVSIYTFAPILSPRALEHGIQFLSGIRLYGDKDLSLVCVDRNGNKIFICSSFSTLNDYLEEIVIYGEKT